MFPHQDQRALYEAKRQELLREAEREHLLHRAGLAPRSVRDIVLDTSCRLPLVRAAPACAARPAS
jgi:hypothetical protein